jgi:hypothetical protein
MSSDGSAGRRDGFDRWVASMKREQQPMQEKPVSLKDMDKLELDLDENATHVHRIPKDLINRMREQRAQERQAQKQLVTESVVRPAPAAAPAPPPASAKPAFESQVQHAFGGEDEDFESALGGVSDDRTAVFRPPPELLARAKRMKPPAKPNPTSELPTKPPPAGELGDGVSSLPASAKVPGFESAPVMARASAVAARAAAPALEEPYASTATAAAAARTETMTAEALAEQPSSSPEIERSAVFAHSEPTSGVMSLGVPEAPVASESSRVVALTAEEPVAPLSNDALLLAVAPPAGEPSAPEAIEDEEAPAPTTTSPMVRSERSVAPEAAPAKSSRLLVWLVAAAAAAALVYYRLHHGF